MTSPLARETTVRVEQRIARGDTVLDICRTLRVSEDDVVEVWLRMETINGQADYEAPTTRGRPAGQRVHGTYGGYKQHKRKGTAPCAPCLAARGVYVKERRAARRAGVA